MQSSISRMSEAQKRNVVVAVEDSAASERACQWAVDNILRPGDKVHLMHVVLEPHMGIIPGASDDIPVNLPSPAANHAYVQHVEDFIQRRFVPLLHGADCKVEIVERRIFRTDSAAVGEVLCEEAARLDAAALVMAKKDKGPIHQFVLGSTSDYCSKHYPLPLVITH